MSWPGGCYFQNKQPHLTLLAAGHLLGEGGR